MSAKQTKQCFEHLAIALFFTHFWHVYYSWITQLHVKVVY